MIASALWAGTVLATAQPLGPFDRPTGKHQVVADRTSAGSERGGVRRD